MPLPEKMGGAAIDPGICSNPLPCGAPVGFEGAVRFRGSIAPAMPVCKLAGRGYTGAEPGNEPLALGGAENREI